jgi:hypothetical protein
MKPRSEEHRVEQGDTSELELSEKIVAFGQGTFALEDLDQDCGLIVSGSGENLALASGDNSVAGDEFGHNTTSGFDTESKRVNINKDNITQALVTSENTTLNGSTVGNSLVRVDTLGRFLSEVLLEELLNFWNAGRTANENDPQDTSAKPTKITRKNPLHQYPPSSGWRLEEPAQPVSWSS